MCGLGDILTVWYHSMLYLSGINAGINFVLFNLVTAKYWVLIFYFNDCKNRYILHANKKFVEAIVNNWKTECLIE